MRRLAALLALCAALVAGHASAAHAEAVPPPTAPAARVDLARVMAEQVAIANALVLERAPSWSHCPSLYGVALESWPGAAEDWARLDYIMWRESRCRPTVVNRYGCVGLLQVCRGNHARLGLTRADLQDAATNIATGYTLCQESLQAGRSCWRPWWTRGFRP